MKRHSDEWRVLLEEDRICRVKGARTAVQDGSGWQHSLLWNLKRYETAQSELTWEPLEFCWPARIYLRRFDLTRQQILS